MPGIWEEARKRDWEMRLKTNYSKYDWSYNYCNFGRPERYKLIHIVILALILTPFSQPFLRPEIRSHATMMTMPTAKKL